MTTTPLTASELHAYTAAYRPASLDVAAWERVSPELLTLVKVGGAATHPRVKSDLTALSGMIAHLAERGRPLTLEEMLSEQAILSYDIAMQRSGESHGHRSNKRSSLRRLRAAHDGAPSRAPNRSSADRIDGLVSHTRTEELERLLAAAEASTHRGAAALIAAVAQVRSERSGSDKIRPLPGWTKAQKFAMDNGMPLGLLVLRKIVAHEVLELPLPFVVTAARYHLTREDMELALTRVRELPETPDAGVRNLLRGVRSFTAKDEGVHDCTS